MLNHIRPVWAEINLDNLKYNMKEIRKISKSRDIIGVVKADAYGHGALEVSKVILENGATALAVATSSEAVQLRKGGIKAPVMILGYTPVELLDEIIENDVQQTIYSYDAALNLSRTAREKNKTAKIHIAVDTGMGRIGFAPNEESINEVIKISRLPNITIEGMFSHFSTSDEKDKKYSLYQLENFNWFYDKLKKNGININVRHIANSAAIIDMPGIHFEAVRPGIILYGYYPSDEVNKGNLSLKPVMSLKAKISNIKTLPEGKYISYGRKFVTKRKSVIATLPIGYADGFSRGLSGKAKVIVNGNYADVVGRICMDQCMIDVTDIEKVSMNNEVTIMGEYEKKGKKLSITADDIAKELGTISYEILCMISKRVPRVYIQGGKVVEVKNYV